MRNKRFVLITIFILLVCEFRTQEKKFFTKDTVHHFFVSADVKSTPADRSVRTVPNSEGEASAIFNGYYKYDLLTDISVESYFRHKSGVLLGLRTQYYPNTVFGKKLNHFLLLGYSFKVLNKFYFAIRIGITNYRFTYFEYKDKSLGKITYVDQNTPPKDTTINGIHYPYWRPTIEQDLIFHSLHNFYMDGQILYFIATDIGISMNFSLLREDAGSGVYIPRMGIGMGGTSYSYVLYIKSIGLGITLKF